METARFSNRSAHYRNQAAHIRELSEQEPVGKLRDRLLDVARQYEELAASMERSQLGYPAGQGRRRNARGTRHTAARVDKAVNVRCPPSPRPHPAGPFSQGSGPAFPAKPPAPFSRYRAGGVLLKSPAAMIYRDRGKNIVNRVPPCILQRATGNHSGLGPASRHAFSAIFFRGQFRRVASPISICP